MSRRLRVYTDQALAVGNQAELEAGPARHLVRVLRQRVGGKVVLFNGDGCEYAATITHCGPGDRCSVRIDETLAANTESPLAITLVQAIARGDRMDWCIQKSAELGVTAIQPIFTERTEVRLKGQRADKRQRHWRQVAIAACEQSGRVHVPGIAEPIDLSDLPEPDGRGLLLDPGAERSLATAGAPPEQGVQILIGPEGGLTEAEAGWLERHGWTGIRLGPRVLRSETAGPAAIAALQVLYGDWQ